MASLTMKAIINTAHLMFLFSNCTNSHWDDAVAQLVG